MAFGDIVQSKSVGTQFGEDGTSVSVTLDSTPTDGNLLLALHFTGHANSIAPSGFSEAVALTDSGQSDQGAIYYKIAGAAESSTVTCTSGGSDEHTLTVLEVEGSWHASPLDVTASAGPTDSTTTQSSGTTATTAQNDEFAVALITNRSKVSPQFSGWTNSFVERSDVQSRDKSGGTATKLLTSTGTVETTATITSARSMGGVATFKKQAVGGTIIPLVMHHMRQQGMT